MTEKINHHNAHKAIKVKIPGGEHSAGRGIGFYRDNLVAALEDLSEVEIVEDNPDLVHYPFFDLFYLTLPQKLDYPTVVTIHDLTPLVLSNLYPHGLRARLSLAAQKRALKNVAAVLTDSLCSKKDIVHFLHLDEQQVFVTPLAADPAYSQKPSASFINNVKEKYHLPDEFILYVGGINANKNLVRLSEAAINLDTHLVLVGGEFVKPPVETFSFKKLLGLQRAHPEIRQFNELKEIISGNPLFLVLGFVPTADLNAIYRLASLYVQPSLYEGFGLPLLEAMSASCLFVSSHAGSLTEIIPSESIIFDPANQPSIEKAIRDTLALPEKEKARFIKLGREKTKEFSWEKTAKATLAVYQSVLKK